MESVVEFQLKDGNMKNIALIKDIVEKNEFKLNPHMIDIQKEYDQISVNGNHNYSPEEFKKIYPTVNDYAYFNTITTPLVIDIEGNLHSRGTIFKKHSIEEYIEWNKNYYDRFFKDNTNCYASMIYCSY